MPGGEYPNRLRFWSVGLLALRGVRMDFPGEYPSLLYRWILGGTICEVVVRLVRICPSSVFLYRVGNTILPRPVIRQHWGFRIGPFCHHLEDRCQILLCVGGGGVQGFCRKRFWWILILGRSFQVWRGFPVGLCPALLEEGGLCGGH